MSSTGLPAPRLLDSVDEITPEWMQQVFGHAGLALPRITGVANRPIGHGNLSNTVVTRLSYEGEAGNAPASVVCKFTSGLPVAVLLAGTAGVYSREIMTYRLLGEAPPVRTPRCYLAETDPGGTRLNLVMEDLSAFAEPGDQIAGCSVPDAYAAISEFASLHSLFWDSPALEGLDWLFSSRPRTGAASSESFGLGARVSAERFRDRLPDEVFAAIEAFAPQVGEWANAPVRRKTLVHHEARADNIVFDRRDPSHIRAYIIDWQFTSCGDPQYDVAYFASGSLTPEDRRTCERGLIEVHAAKMREIEPGYSVAEATDAYRFYLPSGLMTTLSAALVLPPGEHEDLLLMTLLQRNVTALTDWGLVGHAGRRPNGAVAAPDSGL